MASKSQVVHITNESIYVSSIWCLQSKIRYWTFLCLETSTIGSWIDARRTGSNSNPGCWISQSTMRVSASGPMYLQQLFSDFLFACCSGSYSTLYSFIMFHLASVMNTLYTRFDARPHNTSTKPVGSVRSSWICPFCVSVRSGCWYKTKTYRKSGAILGHSDVTSYMTREA